MTKPLEELTTLRLAISTNDFENPTSPVEQPLVLADYGIVGMRDDIFHQRNFMILFWKPQQLVVTNFLPYAQFGVKTEGVPVNWVESTIKYESDPLVYSFPLRNQKRRLLAPNIALNHVNAEVRNAGQELYRLQARPLNLDSASLDEIAKPDEDGLKLYVVNNHSLVVPPGYETKEELGWLNGSFQFTINPINDFVTTGIVADHTIIVDYDASIDLLSYTMPKRILENQTGRLTPHQFLDAAISLTAREGQVTTAPRFFFPDTYQPLTFPINV
jgi:hypothetical protein